MADIMKGLADSMSGKTKPRENYVLRDGKSEPKKKMAKKPAKKSAEEKPVTKTRPVKKRRKIESTPKVDLNKAMRGESEVIVNDIPEVADRKDLEAVERGATIMGHVQKEAPNYLVGLAPLAMGALMGDIGTGAAVGGQMLIDQELRKEKRYDTALKAKRKLASGSKSLKGYMKDGVPTWGTPEEVHGKQMASPTMEEDIFSRKLKARRESKALEDKLRGSDMEIFDDGQGRKTLRNKQTGAMTPLFGKGSLSDTQIKRINTVRDKLYASTEKAVTGYRDMSSSLMAMTEENDLAAKDALKQYIKRTEGGKLTDFDVLFQKNLLGAPGLLERTKEFASGKLNKRLAMELKGELTRALMNTRKDIASKYKKAYTGATANEISPSTMRKHIQLPEGLSDGATIQIKGKKTYTGGHGPT